MNKPKIIVLSAIKNEEWIIRRFLQVMSQIADHILIADQKSEDTTRAICAEFPKVVVVENESESFNEPERQKLLIETARKLYPGPRLLLSFDADDIPSANILDDPEWAAVLHARPGVPILLQNVCMYGSPNNYRSQGTDSYGVSYLPYAMIDNGAPHSGLPIHSPRLPFRRDVPPIRLNKVVSMHFQFVDSNRAMAKQRWYMCYERLRFPNKSSFEILNDYRWVIWDVHTWPDRETPREWLSGYEKIGIDLADVQRQNYFWWTWEVLRFFFQYGEQTFAELPIWDYDWEEARNNGIIMGITGLPNREIRDPRSNRTRFAHWILSRWGSENSAESVVDSAQSGFRARPPESEKHFNASSYIPLPGGKYSSGDNSDEALPLISIITPAYNRASYLDETIQSVLNQDYPSIEYIVLDDGSTDNTKEMLEKYTGKLIWETHPNMGESRTVNKGWSMAHGEIVCVVNSDDPLLPGAISSAVAFMQLHPDILVAYPDWNIIGPDSKVIQHIQVREYNYLYMVRQHFCSPGPGAFIRRKAFELAGYRDPDFKYVADFEYWLRLGLYGKFARIPKTLATWRRHPGAATVSSQGVEMANEHVRLLQKYYSRADLTAEIRNIKTEAFSGAYYVAGIAAGTARRVKIWYYLKSIACHPQSYVRDLDRSFSVACEILRAALPGFLFSLLKRLWPIVRPFLRAGRWLIKRILTAFKK